MEAPRGRARSDLEKRIIKETKDEGTKKDDTKERINSGPTLWPAIF